MRLHFDAEQWLPLPVPVVFAFFANPANLPPLMPAWQQARIDSASFRSPPPRPEGSPDGIAAGDGTELTITARPFPFSPFRGTWVARIEEFRWNEGFCDVQLKGPFRYWRHCHTVRSAASPAAGFAAEKALGTMVHDHVEYELPFLRNGRKLNDFFVSRIMRRLFQERQEKAARLLLPAAALR